MNNSVGSPEVLCLLAGGVILLPVLFIVGMVLYAVRDAQQLGKIPINAFPQTPDEYLAFDHRVRMARFNRYRPFYIISIIVGLGIPFCFFSGLPCRMITVIVDFFSK